MTGDVMQQLLNEVIRNVDMVVLICLLALGFCIKHLKFLAKVQNDLIPPFLLFVAIVIEFIQHGFSITSIVIAIVTTAIAIGLHTQGKNIFTVTIIPKIIELLKGISSGIEDSLLGEDDEYECDVGEEEAGEDSD